MKVEDAARAPPLYSWHSPFLCTWRTYHKQLRLCALAPSLAVYAGLALSQKGCRSPGNSLSPCPVDVGEFPCAPASGESCSSQQPRSPPLNGALAADSSNLLLNTPCFLPFSVSLPHAFTHTSQNHFLSKLLALNSSPSSSGESKPKQWRKEIKKSRN